VFKYEDQGVATLEDGLWVLEERLEDPDFVETMAKFVRASMKGWEYARENPQEAAEIVLDYDETGAQQEHHQVRMMEEINKLTEGSTGVLDPADYERTVETLLSAGSEPVITEDPGDAAWSHAVTDKAFQ
jgi:NitT/TauT family transport system substrate-binding protein